MPTLRTSAGELYYEDHGDGRPVVFIHGLWLTSRFFQKQREAVSERYRFIAPDLRSHGRSETVLHGNTVPMQARDLHELFESLDLHDMVLVRWSSGAFCIWQYLLGLRSRARPCWRAQHDLGQARAAHERGT